MYTNRSIHQSTWHQYRFIHMVDRFHEFFHQIDDALAGKFGIIIGGNAP